jgi:hypothetical protein
MRFILHADAWQTDEDRFQIEGILLKVEDRWHNLDSTDCSKLINSDWFADMISSAQQLVKAALTHSVTSGRPKRGPHVREVNVSYGSLKGALSPKKARLFAETPLMVVVENRFSDAKKGFASRILDILAPATTDLVEIGALVFDSGGGIMEIPKVVKEKLERAQALGIPPRVVTFMDGDTRYPGDTTSDGAKQSLQAKTACEKSNVSLHRLAKRSIENYLPDEALQGWAKARGKARGKWVDWVNALKKLSPDQRDHFPLRGGFQKVRGQTSSRRDEFLIAQASRKLEEWCRETCPGGADKSIMKARFRKIASIILDIFETARKSKPNPSKKETELYKDVSHDVEKRLTKGAGRTLDMAFDPTCWKNIDEAALEKRAGEDLRRLADMIVDAL